MCLRSYSDLQCEKKYGFSLPAKNVNIKISTTLYRLFSESHLEQTAKNVWTLHSHWHKLNSTAVSSRWKTTRTINNNNKIRSPYILFYSQYKMKNCRFPLVRPKIFWGNNLFSLVSQFRRYTSLATARHITKTERMQERTWKKVIIDRHLLFGMNVRTDSIISHVLCVVNTTHTHISLFHEMFCQHGSQYRICVIGVVRGPI